MILCYSGYVKPSPISAPPPPPYTLLRTNAYPLSSSSSVVPGFADPYLCTERFELVDRLIRVSKLHPSADKVHLPQGYVPPPS